MVFKLCSFQLDFKGQAVAIIELAKIKLRDFAVFNSVLSYG